MATAIVFMWRLTSEYWYAKGPHGYRWRTDYQRRRCINWYWIKVRICYMQQLMDAALIASTLRIELRQCTVF